MYKYFTNNNTYRYLDVINKFLTGYNSVYPAIGMPLSKVNHSNIYSVCRKVNSLGANIPHGRVNFKVGDLVRITKEKLWLVNGMNKHLQMKYLGLSRLFRACPNLFTYSLTCRIGLSMPSLTIMNLSVLLYHPEPSSQ
jgi:hypothetical protein